MTALGVLLTLLAATPAVAETGTVGDLELLGPAAAAGWPGAFDGFAYTLVCNVDDGGSMTVRARPSSNATVVTRLRRFTTVEVDTGQIQGSWVRVVSADESYTADGMRQPFRSLGVEGWAYVDFLCAFEER
ncbi:MAG: SH3 domain-containing protein [Pseudomonadota bacterium]